MTNLLAMILLQSDFQGGEPLDEGLGAGLTIVYLLVLLVVIAAWWRMFQKAGKPGWAAIIPIYNMIVLLQVARKPVWWIILLFIPFVNFVVMIIVVLAVARNFGKGGGFGAGLFFLPMIFYPILAWGDAQYQPTE